jgi:hypothetical protein
LVAPLLLALLLGVFTLGLNLPEEDTVDDLLLELGCDFLQPLIGIAVALTDKVLLQMAVLLQKEM